MNAFTPGLRTADSFGEWAAIALVAVVTILLVSL